jgi:hypothetical protein
LQILNEIENKLGKNKVLGYKSSSLWQELNFFSPPLNTKGKVSCIYGEKAKKQEKASSKRGAILH